MSVYEYLLCLTTAITLAGSVASIDMWVERKFR